MVKLIKDKAPFILLACNFIFIICKYFGIYEFMFAYLGDLVGYSLLTNIFMYIVYNNKRYCTATKMAVLGLISLNIFSLVWKATDINGIVYNFFLIIIIALILVIHKFKI